MVAYVVQFVMMLRAHMGPEVLEEFEDFEGMEDLAEPEDLELLM